MEAIEKKLLAMQLIHRAETEYDRSAPISLSASIAISSPSKVDTNILNQHLEQSRTPSPLKSHRRLSSTESGRKDEACPETPPVGAFLETIQGKDKDNTLLISRLDRLRRKYVSYLDTALEDASDPVDISFLASVNVGPLSEWKPLDQQPLSSRSHQSGWTTSRRPNYRFYAILLCYALR